MSGRTSAAVVRGDWDGAPEDLTGWTRITLRPSSTARTSPSLPQTSPLLTLAKVPPTSSPVLRRAKAAGKKLESVNGRNIKLPAETNRRSPASRGLSRTAGTAARIAGSATNVRLRPNLNPSQPRSQWDPPGHLGRLLPNPASQDRRHLLHWARS